MHDLLLYDFNLCYNLMKKSLLERAMTYKKFVRQFQILQKNNSKIQILKLLKDQKILKNQMIHCLEIIETKQNIYDYTIEKYKGKMGYFQKNNFNYCKLFYLVKNG